jgi:hypothetical protein
MVDQTKLTELVTETNEYLDLTNLSQVLPLFCDFEDPTSTPSSKLDPCFTK